MLDPVSDAFPYAFQRPVTKKAPPFTLAHWVVFPFPWAPPHVLDAGSLWTSADLLPYVSSLPLPGKYSNTLKMLGLYGQEKGEPGIFNMVMSPCSM